MQSPFEIFRKHQKMLTVVLTGLAMFAFVILGAVPDPSNMPPLLGAIFIGGVVGGLAWLAGIRKKKSNEWGTAGFIAGLGIGLAAMMAVGPGDVVLADTGNITQLQMEGLYRQRAVANQFMSMGYQRAMQNGMQPTGRAFGFGFGHPDEEKDIVVGELLRREAQRLGMQVTDDAVNDFIRGRFQDKIGSSDLTEIRSSMGVSETTLYECLQAELMAFHASQFLYGGITVPNGSNPLPPVAYWDFYRKMNVQSSVGIVPLSVDAFVDHAAEPNATELQALFDEYKANYPNTTDNGQLEEGRLGFRQPRRAAIEYIEIPYEAVESTIPEITDEEIEAHYEEFYKRSALDMPAESKDAADGPVLPELTPDKSPAEGEQPEMKSPAAEDKAPADPQPEKPTDPKAEKPQAAPKEEPQPAADAEKTDADKKDASAKQPEKTGESADEQPPAEGEASEGEEGAALSQRSTLQLVAFFDDDTPTASEVPAEAADVAAKDDPAPEKPADDAPAADAGKKSDPPAESPADGEKTASDKQTTADEKTKPAAKNPAGDDKPPAPPQKEMSKDQPASSSDAPASVPAEDQPPVAATQPRELDDDLRAEIREQILRRKTATRQQELMDEVYQEMVDQLSSIKYQTDETSGEASVDPQWAADTSQKLQAYAKEQGLVFERTPLLSFRELEDSEDFPVGHATSATNVQSTASAARLTFMAGPTDQYRAEQVLDIETGSRFVFWKIEDVATYEPESLDDPGIREQVIRAWREQQAREKAKARAEELAGQAAGIDEPLSEIFAGATVTGAEDGPAVSVVHPPRFSWLSAASAQMSPNPFNRPAPTLTELRTVPGDVGEEFMQTVFQQLQTGETGVAHSYDKVYYYVVKVDDRTYGTSPDLQAFRERFATQPVFDQFGFSDYYKLAAQELSQYQVNWADELFQRHNVTFAEPDPEQGNAL